MDTILDIYANFIGSVEKGQLKWGSKQALERLEQSMVLRAITKQRAKSDMKPQKKEKIEKQMPKVVYCLDYNRNRCAELDTHEGKFNSQSCLKHHMCARCLKIEGVKRSHPETDNECPNKNKQ